MSLDLTEDKSTLVQVMAWCRQATSHYLSQCWPRSVSPYGVIRPQWVKTHLYFLSFLDTDMAQEVKSYPMYDEDKFILQNNTMAADGLTTQKSRVSATMVLT